MDKDTNITTQWEKDFNFNLEKDKLDTLAVKNVNNYFQKNIEGKFKAKGSFSTLQLGKSLNEEIISEAVINYIMDNTSIEDTINGCLDISKFLKSQHTKTGTVSFKGEIIQKTNRFFVSNSPEAGYLESETEKKKGRISNNKVRLANDITDNLINLVDKKYYIKEAKSKLSEFLVNQRAKELNFAIKQVVKTLNKQGLKVIPKNYKDNIAGISLNNLPDKFDYSKTPTLGIATGQKYKICAIDVDVPSKLSKELKQLFEKYPSIRVTVDNSNRFKILYKTDNKTLKSGQYFDKSGVEVLYNGKTANVCGAYDYQSSYRLAGELVELPEEILNILLVLQKSKPKKKLGLEDDIQECKNISRNNVKNFLETYLKERNIEFKIVEPKDDFEKSLHHDKTPFVFTFKCPGILNHSSKNSPDARLIFAQENSFYMSCFHTSCKSAIQAFISGLNKEANIKFKLKKQEVLKKEMYSFDETLIPEISNIEIKNLVPSILELQEKTLVFVKAPTGTGKTYNLILAALEFIKRGEKVAFICATNKEVRRVIKKLKEHISMDKISCVIQGGDSDPKKFKEIVVSNYEYLNFKGDSSEIYKLAKAILEDRNIICDEIQAIQGYSDKNIPLFIRYTKEGSIVKSAERCLHKLKKTKDSCQNCYLNRLAYLDKHLKYQHHKTLPSEYVENQHSENIKHKLVQPSFYNTVSFKTLKIKKIDSVDNDFKDPPFFKEHLKFHENIELRCQFPYIEDENGIRYLTPEEIAKMEDEDKKQIKYPVYCCQTPIITCTCTIIYSNLFQYAKRIIATSATIPYTVEQNFIKKAQLHEFSIAPTFEVKKALVTFDVSLLKLENELSHKSKAEILKNIKNSIFLVEARKTRAKRVFQELKEQSDIRSRVAYFYGDNYESTFSAIEKVAYETSVQQDVILTHANSPICKAVDMPMVDLVIVDCSQFLPTLALPFDENTSFLDMSNFQAKNISDNLYQIIGRVFRSKLKINQDIQQVEKRKIVILLHCLPHLLQDFEPPKEILNSCQSFSDNAITGKVASKQLENLILSIKEGLSGSPVTPKDKLQIQKAFDKGVEIGLKRLQKEHRRDMYDVLTEEQRLEIKQIRKVDKRLYKEGLSTNDSRQNTLFEQSVDSEEGENG